jgi:hypothetical protein
MGWSAGCALALLSFGGAVAAAPAACTPWRDEQGMLKVGRYTIDTPVAALAGLRKSKRKCQGPDDDKPRHCEFFDRDGVAYLTDLQGVVRIEARRGQVGSGAALPLGLVIGDSMAEVERKLEALPAPPALRDPLLSQTKRRPAPRAVATGECVVHDKATPASFFLEFDAKQRLRLVGLMRSNV